MILSINKFSELYRIDRRRLTRLVEAALRTHSGVFGLEGLGYFKASRPAPGAAFEIDTYNPSAHEAEELPLHQINGRGEKLSDPAPAPASPISADEPTAYSLDLRLKAEKVEQLRQRNVLEQARLREETVSYCAASIQLLLSGLRSELNELHLPHETGLAIRDAIADALSDLTSILPEIVAGVPVDSIELTLNARRAARIIDRKQKERPA